MNLFSPVHTLIKFWSKNSTMNQSNNDSTEIQETHLIATHPIDSLKLGTSALSHQGVQEPSTKPLVPKKPLPLKNLEFPRTSKLESNSSSNSNYSASKIDSVHVKSEVTSSATSDQMKPVPYQRSHPPSLKKTENPPSNNETGLNVNIDTKPPNIIADGETTPDSLKTCFSDVPRRSSNISVNTLGQVKAPPPPPRAAKFIPIPTKKSSSITHLANNNPDSSLSPVSERKSADEYRAVYHEAKKSLESISIQKPTSPVNRDTLIVKRTSEKVLTLITELESKKESPKIQTEKHVISESISIRQKAIMNVVFTQHPDLSKSADTMSAGASLNRSDRDSKASSSSTLSWFISPTKKKLASSTPDMTVAQDPRKLSIFSAGPEVDHISEDERSLSSAISSDNVASPVIADSDGAPQSPIKQGPVIKSKKQSSKGARRKTAFATASISITPQAVRPKWYEAIADETERTLFLEKLSKKEKSRQDVAYELVCTEEDYIKDIQLLVDEFIKPMREQKILKPKEMSDIFSNVENLIPLNQAFLDELRKCRKDYLLEDVGRAFISMAEYFKMYTQYCGNHTTSSTTLKKLDTTLKPFLKDVYEKQQTGHNLESYLLKPIQRICKYPLLLRELLKNTDEDHTDYKNLVSAKEKIDVIVQIVNDRTKQAEMMMKTLDAVRRIKGGNNFISPTRFFLYDGPSVLRMNGEPESVAKKCQLFLFNDMLAITRAALLSDKYHVELTLELEALTIFTPEQLPNSIILAEDYTDRYYLFTFGSLEEKAKWITEFSKINILQSEDQVMTNALIGIFSKENPGMKLSGIGVFTTEI